MNDSTKEHWNNIYASSSVSQLGWYETEPRLSLKMIANCSVDKDDPILDVGAGATTLIDYLLNENYRNITVIDISEVALDALRARLGAKKASQVQILVEDITKPDAVSGLKDIVIWHDRALLHFFTEDEQQQTYVSVLKKVLRVGGHVIIAAFAKDGASKCSGLDVKRHDIHSLAALLGDEFEFRESIDYQYQMPSGGIRPYIYVRFQRKVDGSSLERGCVTVAVSHINPV